MRLELFGMARALIGLPAVELTPPEPPTLRGLLGELAARYPQVVGSVLEARTHAPIEPNLVLLDGRRAADLDEALAEADLPCLLFLPSGG
jgi:molybdopterin converting factor small subunit